MMLARAVEHVGYDRSSEYGDNSDGTERVIAQGGVEAEDNEQSDDEPGVGLGLPGLASLTLPSEGMIVPPLNFSMVSDGIFRSGYPIACNFPFLRRLGLRSILCLCPDSMLPGSLQWANEAGVRMEMCELGENSPPFVSMPLTAMTTAVDFLSGERISDGSSKSADIGALPKGEDSDGMCDRLPTAETKVVLRSDLRRVFTLRWRLGKASRHAVHRAL